MKLSLLFALLLHAESLPAAPPQPRGRPPASRCTTEFRSTDVLYLGDSISVLPYSASLAEALTEGRSDFIVARYAVGGSAAIHWMNGFKADFFVHRNTVCDSRGGLAYRTIPGQDFPLFPRLIATAAPRAVVIALGTNDLHNYCTAMRGATKKNPNPGAAWIGGARRLAEAAGGSCVWILPLRYESGQIADACRSVKNGLAGALRTLKETVSPHCATIDSSRECPVRLWYDSVGIHPKEGSEELGKCLGRRVKSLIGL